SQEAVRELKGHFSYSKGNFDANVLIGKTAFAISNAGLIRKAQQDVETEFPKTDVDLLVTEINALTDSVNRLFDIVET
ncbi:MAG: hypothetical protein LBJ48_07715, partial [Coriobacteriales bacterium]|nr:hypothetical protein [Coriobacteriales bacterium]